MKTQTGISLTEKAIALLAEIQKELGVNRSAAIELVVREYCERHGIKLPAEK